MNLLKGNTVIPDSNKKGKVITDNIKGKITLKNKQATGKIKKQKQWK